MPEEILDPDLPIIDPHHHLWDLGPRMAAHGDSAHPFVKALALTPYYTFPELRADAQSGHRIIGTIYMECGAFYNADASPPMKVLGEVEFASGVAAQGASGLYGEFRPCAGIVGHADLMLGDSVAPVLEALTEAGNGRFRGIRHQGAWDADTDVLGPIFRASPGVYREVRFREGFRHLAKQDLTFDAWVLEPQLADVVDLARTFPETTIILDHCGSPLGTASYHGKLHERFEPWRSAIRDLAACSNVRIKLGGLGMAFCGLPEKGPASGLGSETLAAMWRPYIETCIEYFGPERAMFESNFPVDKWSADYATLWNAFKHLTIGASDAEKRALYAGTAAEVYRVEHLLERL